MAREPTRVIGRSGHAGPVAPVKTDPEATARPAAAEGLAIVRPAPPAADPTDREDGMSGHGDPVPDGTSARAASAASAGRDRIAEPHAPEQNGATDRVIARSGPTATGLLEPAPVVVQHARAHHGTGPMGRVINDRPANAPESGRRKPCAKAEVPMRRASKEASASAMPAPNAMWDEVPIERANVAAGRRKKAWAMAASA